MISALASDPIEQAILRGIAAGNSRRRPTQDIRLEARRIRDAARKSGRLQEAVFRLLSFVGDYPRTEEFQKIVARFLHEMQDERALSAWLGISLRFPQSMDSFHNLAVVAHRSKGPRTVRRIIDARFPRMPSRIDELLAYAEASDLAADAEAKRDAFERLSWMFAKRNDAWLVAASWLEEELGASRSAVALLRRVATGVGLRPPLIKSKPTASSESSGLQGGNHAQREQLAPSVKVLGVLFDRVLEGRGQEVATRGDGTGGICMLTGSLGAGGAERQFVNTAVGLHRMHPAERRLQNGMLLGPVQAVARSLRDRQDGAFFLSELQEAGLQVRSYRELPDFAGDLASSVVRPALTALGYLPWSTAEAVIKLTDWLRVSKPEVVHIWQDGLVYAAGLAALLAGVPRIILSGRSTPPPDRRDRYLVEYDVIYKSLLRAPGVKLSVNSQYSAKRYSNWLDIDPTSISVIPNGVAKLGIGCDSHAAALWESFRARTGDSQFTLGAVMRLDEVKQPLLWIDTAAALYSLRRDVRFVIVGDGPFRTRLERRAEALGIASRCLLVGRSVQIGYWLSKMDCLMLLSEHEGLPNVLIEAQLAGVPVVTTPAGGAPETVISAKTGIVTKAHPAPQDVADLVFRLAESPELLSQMSIQAAKWAQEAFPVSKMLSKTLELYNGAGCSPNSARNVAVNMFASRLHYMEE